MKPALFIALMMVCFSFSPSLQSNESEFRHELSPQAAFFSGDALRSHFLFGLQYAFHLNSLIWVGIDGFGKDLSIDQGAGLEVDDGDSFYGTNASLYLNLPVFFTQDVSSHSWHGDLYTSVGGGVLWMDRKEHPFAFVGGGMLIYTPLSWFALRFDLKNTFYKVKNTRGSDFQMDMILSLGPSFLF